MQCQSLGVGRVHKNQIKTVLLQLKWLFQIPFQYCDRRRVVTKADGTVFTDNRQSCRVIIYKHCMLCTTTQCLQAKSARAGKKIKYNCSCDTITQNVKKSLPALIGSRSNMTRPGGWRHQSLPLKYAADDSQSNTPKGEGESLENVPSITITHGAFKHCLRNKQSLCANSSVVSMMNFRIISIHFSCLLIIHLSCIVVLCGSSE